MKNAEKMEKMIKIIRKLNDIEYSYIKKMLNVNFTDEQLKLLDVEYSTKNMTLESQNIKNDNSISQIYGDEIFKIASILNNDSLLNDIGGLKILFFGKTGTGKTSLVKEIAKMHSNYEFISKSLEELISSKMGQTQINLIALANDLNASYKNKKIILFLDEIDSIINSRTNPNDVAEHGRIVSTFIKFLDILDKNIVLFAATNLINSIDEAVQRRFNIKVEGNLFSIDNFFKIYQLEGGKITPQNINKIKSIIVKNHFSISELNEFKSAIEIEKMISKNFDIKIIFIKLFQNKVSINKRKWSDRDLKIMKKGGLNVNI